jgi:hypothetical protein
MYHQVQHSQILRSVPHRMHMFFCTVLTKKTVILSQYNINALVSRTRRRVFTARYELNL